MASLHDYGPSAGSVEEAVWVGRLHAEIRTALEKCDGMCLDNEEERQKVAEAVVKEIAGPFNGWPR